MQENVEYFAFNPAIQQILQIPKLFGEIFARKCWKIVRKIPQKTYETKLNVAS